MPLGRRRPLLRAAMVGGGAYAAGKHRERSQEAAQQEQQPASGSGGGLSDADVSQLQKLGELRDQGILTPAEFEAQKQALLGGAR
ncbi:MAG TPA: SHOCT domain-containing protein [Conexibacter sp.]|jgi:hypothetical protein|nr:SHOCT domain-containing protein [Conexibacter sp.]